MLYGGPNKVVNCVEGTLIAAGELTNNSSAVGDLLFSVGEAMLAGDCTLCTWLLSEGSKKGFLETGLAGAGSSNGEWGGGGENELGVRALFGDAARLRKGLFDERLSVNPADRPLDWPMPTQTGEG